MHVSFPKVLVKITLPCKVSVVFRSGWSASLQAIGGLQSRGSRGLLSTAPELCSVSPKPALDVVISELNPSNYFAFFIPVFPRRRKEKRSRSRLDIDQGCQAKTTKPKLHSLLLIRTSGNMGFLLSFDNSYFLYEPFQTLRNTHAHTLARDPTV